MSAAAVTPLRPVPPSDPVPVEVEEGAALPSDVAAVILRVQDELRAIVPERLYTPEEAAELLAMRSERGAKTLGEVSRRLLAVTYVGPSGGLRRYYGRDLIQYIQRCRKER